MRRGWLPILIVGVAILTGYAPGGGSSAIDTELARAEARKKRGAGAGAGALPFGFDIKKHPAAYGFCEKQAHLYILNSWNCSQAPRPHPAFENYAIQYVEGIGACAVWGIGQSIWNDPTGNKTRKIVDVLSEQLATKYGKGRKRDFLKDGSTLKGPKEWLKGIKQGDRRYAYDWALIYGFKPVGNVAEIYLDAKARSFIGDYVGYAHLLFILKTSDACDKKIREDAAKSF